MVTKVNTETEEAGRPRQLTDDEKETIMGFDRTPNMAYVFTYEKTWQRHFEKDLGLKPVMDNGVGGREYRFDKKLIRMPMGKRHYSPEVKEKMKARLAKMRQKPLF